jgi:hypothetical protein
VRIHQFIAGKYSKPKKNKNKDSGLRIKNICEQFHSRINRTDFKSHCSNNINNNNI